MTRILFIAPGDNVHTWKWVGWFGKKYPGQIDLLPYQSHAPKDTLPEVLVHEPQIPRLRIASPVSWLQFGRVRELVRHVNPQLLHALWTYGPGIYAARSEHHPFVLSPWGSDITIYPNRPGIKGAIQRNLILEAVRKADRMTATSRFLADAIHALVPDRDSPDLFPYGVDTSIFSPDKAGNPLEFRWPDGAPEGPDSVTVGFFKALDPTYGPDHLIEAIASAAEQVPNVRCVIAGSGPMKNYLLNLAVSLDIADRICFPGHIPHSDIPRALAGIDIFAMPSRYEVFGVSAIEASAMEKPVIVTRKWGMVEVIEDGVTGLFIEPDDVNALAGHIVKLARHPELRSRMGAAGRKFVQEKFEFDKIMQSADEYCTRIIEGASVI